jgi:hypothetical protein
MVLELRTVDKNIGSQPITFGGYSYVSSYSAKRGEALPMATHYL